MHVDVNRFARGSLAACLLGSVLCAPGSAAPISDAEAQAREDWREAITRAEVPSEGCFYASYPTVRWLKVACTAAPNRPYLPRRSTIAGVVGDGLDFAASVTGLMTRSSGTFIAVNGLTSETGDGVPNSYSLQLNSNFMTTAACNHVAGCQSWQQFIYSSTAQTVFIQYWLLDYGTPCPKPWTSFGGSCYRNSAAVAAPQQPITELGHLKLSASATLNGRDVLIFSTATEAYSIGGKDSVVDLATGWQETEFNIFGDGDASQATFNPGVMLRVQVAVTDGSTRAPV
jgi:hypothetical protein